MFLKEMSSFFQYHVMRRLRTIPTWYPMGTTVLFMHVTIVTSKQVAAVSSTVHPMGFGTEQNLSVNVSIGAV